MSVVYVVLLHFTIGMSPTTHDLLVGNYTSMAQCEQEIAFQVQTQAQLLAPANGFIQNAGCEGVHLDPALMDAAALSIVQKELQK